MDGDSEAEAPQSFVNPGFRGAMSNPLLICGSGSCDEDGKPSKLVCVPMLLSKDGFMMWSRGPEYSAGL